MTFRDAVRREGARGKRIFTLSRLTTCDLRFLIGRYHHLTLVSRILYRQ